MKLRLLLLNGPARVAELTAWRAACIVLVVVVIVSAVVVKRRGYSLCVIVLSCSSGER